MLWKTSQFLTISLQHLDENLGHEGYGTYLEIYTPRFRASSNSTFVPPIQVHYGWRTAQITNQVFLSWASTVTDFHSDIWQLFSVNSSTLSWDAPGSRLPSIYYFRDNNYPRSVLYITCCSDCTTRTLSQNKVITS